MLNQCIKCRIGQLAAEGSLSIAPELALGYCEDGGDRGTEGTVPLFGGIKFLIKVTSTQKTWVHVTAELLLAKSSEG